MIDFTGVKAVTIPEGTVKQITRKSDGTILWKSGYKNWVKYSTESDGVTIYNGGLGYKNGYRVRSGGAEGADNNAACTGFIPVSPGDAVYVTGMPWFTGSSSANAMNVADAAFTNIGQFTMEQNAKYGIFASEYLAYTASSIIEVERGVWKWIVPPAASGIAYIRVSGYNVSSGPPGANMIVTVNEEIT